MNYYPQGQSPPMQPKSENMLKHPDTEVSVVVTTSQLHTSRPKGFINALNPRSRFRWKEPHFYQEPAWKYDQAYSYRHRDGMTRVWQGAEDDRYISPYDGHIAKLVVQCTDEIYENPGNSTYRRTYIRNVSTKMLRLANWPTSHFDFEKGEYREFGTGWLVAKWIPTCLALTVMIVFYGDGAQERNGGNYDVFAYRYHGYAKVARNVLEYPSSSALPYGTPDAPAEGSNPVMERLLSPRYLCVLQNPSDKNGNSGVSIQKIEDSNNNSWVGSYLFIAYTAEQFSHSSEEDMQALHAIAETAARAAGLPAYWVGCSCMPDEREMEDDVFRISDVIRGSAGLCIAVGPSHGSSLSEKDTWDMLRQWGSRLWTFPEVLLSPKGAPVTVYRRDQLDSPLAVPKNQFAKRVWADAAVARQLVDHYEGNLTLSRLELDTIALRCLHSRATTQYLPGDHSYALMGLLRVRPKVDHTDSAFQAFARLSLANDSNMLLERLVCTLPKTPAQHWSCMDDAWDASLWDIQPQIQIAGICDDDAIIIDNALGAAIRWKSFAPVKNLRRTSWKRLFAQLILHSSGILLIISFTLFISPYTRSAGIVLFLLSFPFIAAGPHLLRMLYSGKFWYSQPWFFGFEGYMDVETIESQIWGARLGRLEWSAFGSPLARHRRNEHGERIGVDPTSDPKVAEIVERAKTASPNEQRVFTLIDTRTMEVILFQANRPPVGILVCGSEGGMQRAVGVSYDWTTATCFRETVFRLDSTVHDKMDRVSRTKLGLKRPATRAVYVGDN
ncbi:3-hydroxyisobutyrate dehydrogenase [Lasiodiplodia theobromae]|uniref:3-hydroxyisobutyrate dehydrogenase n=1 Tax=Lasiodiplodia theobromae TaxID=45133 RepID=UPI0015C3218D|nr:3-hydroxyisobutyrate dehydrogenase [Lasiodiplodia theobromae]KAF4539923.1 3-hydroxyisobutyrate dehydrogenase [Lasiodiplodia theobromae]